MKVNQTPDEPVDLEALFAQAMRDHNAGRLSEAAAAYETILSLRPDVAEVHTNLGLLFCQLGQFDQAAARFQQAIALKPNLADAHNHLGRIFDQHGELEPAAAHYEQALALRPDLIETRNWLGLILAQQGRLDEAVARLEQAIALAPDYAEAYNNLGTVLWRQDKVEQAATRIRQAIALRPEFAEAHNNLGSALAQQNQLAEAAAHFERAIALAPDNAQAHYNLGKLLLNQNQFESALARFERACALSPGIAEMQYALATCYLLREDYGRGWPAFEWRLKLPGAGIEPNLPRWMGEPLMGKSLLLLAEGGLGDTIQFLRYVRQFKARGARVVLAVQSPLGPLLRSFPDFDELFLFGSSDEPPRCDFYLRLLSSPGMLGTTAATIPREVPYLRADPELTDRWRKDLAEIEGFKIGIVWQGSRSYTSDRWRSVPLAHFAPLARVPGVRLISLQKGFGSEQIASVDFPVLDLSGRLDETTGPFMDTAALISNLDLVVAPDTAIGHLAGALGAPVWLALPAATDWRWVRGRDDSPWYPTARLFRQQTFGQWPDVFARMADALRKHGLDISNLKDNTP